MIQRRILWAVSATIISALIGCNSAHTAVPQLPTTDVHASATNPGMSINDTHNANFNPSTLGSLLSGHLYVADAAGVQRFAIINGKPSGLPITYTGVTAPIALDSKNHLYATSGLTVFVYGATSTRPIRSVHVVDTTVTILSHIGAVAVDQFGHLYLTIGVRYCRPASAGCPIGFAKAVYVYAANATGNAIPLRHYLIDGCPTDIGCFIVTSHDQGGLVLDKAGELLVASVERLPVIYAFSSPETRAINVRSLTGSGVVNPGGLAVDALDELYVDNNPSGSAPFIAAYPATASGRLTPGREIFVRGAKSFGSGMATSASLMFIPDPLANVVYEVNPAKSGLQSPIATLSVKAPTDVKIGP